MTTTSRCVAAVLLTSGLSISSLSAQATPAACGVMRTAYRSEQVERPVRLQTGQNWPRGWREVTPTTSPAGGIDTLVARTMALTPARAKPSTPIPARWVAFVVDSTGHVASCSVRTSEVNMTAADLAGATRGRRFDAARVGGRAVNQVVLLAVER